MKKTISIILSISILFLLTTSVIAQNNNDIEQDYYTLNYSENGEYVIANSGGLIVHKYSDFDEYYISSDRNMYFLKQPNNTFIEVRKVCICLNDNSLEEKLESYNINERIIRDILSHANNLNQGSSQIEFFISNNRESPEISSTTTTIGNKVFHNQIYHYIGASSGYHDLVRGSTTTQTNLNNIVNVSISTAGIFNQTVSIIGTGVSVLQAFIDYFGLTPIYCNTENYVQVDFESDVYYKYTFYYHWGVDLLEYTTEKVTINSIELRSHQMTSEGGKTQTTYSFPNSTYKTTNYDNPEGQAYVYYLNGFEAGIETVQAKVPINSTTYVNVVFQ